MTRIKRDQSEWQEKNIVSILYHISKSRAKKKGLEFNIEKSDIVIPDICPILRIPFDHSRYKGRRFNGASIDRIDSSKGYTEDNVQWVHKNVNNMKMQTSHQDFLNWCKLITEYNAA